MFSSSRSFVYDPNTSIYLIKREKIDRKFLVNKEYLNDISLKTNTKINFYSNGDLNDNNTTVYFTVNGVYEARCDALEMLRDETGKAGVIVSNIKHFISRFFTSIYNLQVNLPSLITDDEANRRQLKSSLNRHLSTVKKQCSFAAADDLKSTTENIPRLNSSVTTYNFDAVSQQARLNSGIMKRTKSFHNKFELEKPSIDTISQSSSITSTSSMSSSASSSSSRRKYSHGSSLMPVEMARNSK